MRESILILLAILLTLGVWGQSSAATLDVMSYNIRLDHAGDNDNNWHHRKADMVEYVIDQHPAFVGVQEAIEHQLAYLDAGLSDYAFVGVGRDDGLAGGEFSAILYDTTSWRAVESSTFWLSATPTRVSRGWDAACHRVVTYGVFENKDKYQIAVLNTHFDHVGQEARRESIQLIRDFVATMGDLPVVVMGDFNFTPDDDNYQALTSTLHDTYTVADPAVQVGTFNGFGADEQASRRIDYILTNRQTLAVDYRVDTPKTAEGLQLSDHYPVITTLKISQL